MKNHIIISLLFLLIGCSTDIDTLQNRDGVWYEFNSEEPFSGYVYKEFQSGKKRMKGWFKNGKQEGSITSWYENGQKELVGKFKNGKKDGIYTLWYPSGQMRNKVDFKNGKNNGFDTYWYESGQMRYEILYYHDGNGRIISEKYWNNQGKEITKMGN